VALDEPSLDESSPAQPTRSRIALAASAKLRATALP